MFLGEFTCSYVVMALLIIAAAFVALQVYSVAVLLSDSLSDEYSSFFAILTKWTKHIQVHLFVIM